MAVFRWLQRLPSSSTASTDTTWSQYDSSPPAASDVPDLVYGDLSTPSSSSNDHHPIELIADVRRTPNKLRKPRVVSRASSYLAPLSFIVDGDRDSLGIKEDYSFRPSETSSIAPSSFRYHWINDGSESDANLVLYRSTSSPAMSVSTERATIYSLSSQAPLIRGQSLSRNPLPTHNSPSRKLVKNRRVSVSSVYQSMEDSQKLQLRTPSQQPNVLREAQPVQRRKSSLRFRLAPWKTQTKPSNDFQAWHETGLERQPSDHPEMIPESALPVLPVLQLPSSTPPIPQPVLPSSPIHESPVRSSTDALVNLAWNGNSPNTPVTWGSLEQTVNVAEVDRRAFSVSSARDVPAQKMFTIGVPAEGPSSPRPPLLRRNALSPLASAVFRQDHSITVEDRRRRWSLAMTDNGLTDELFVQTLEEIRSEQHHGDDDDTSSESGGEDADHGRSRARSVPSSALSLPDSGWSNQLHSHPRAPPDSSWPPALRALLITRDLIRTEQNYLDLLFQLLNTYPYPLPSDSPTVAVKETMLPWPVSPPPPVMISRLLSLIDVSRALLTRMKENPSVLGVTTAFLFYEESLESAFTDWCSGVGAWYADDPPRGSRRRLSRSKFSGSSQDKDMDFARNWERRLTMSEASSPVGSESDFSRRPSWRKSIHGTGSQSMTNIASLQRATSLVAGGRQLTSVRELAILPVQRTTRYVLLFRDLSKCTPETAPSRESVIQAAEAAQRIASKCDQAQAHSAFVVKH